MDLLSPLLKQEHDLHRLLNAARPPADLDRRYEQLRAAQASVSTTWNKHLKSEGHFISLHDAHVQGFSERRHGNRRQVRFLVDEICYGEDGEKGYARVAFSLDIPATSSLRQISNQVIHTALLDEAQHAIGFLVHDNNGAMASVVSDYHQLAIRVGPVRTWEQLLIAKHAVGYWERAELTMTFATHTEVRAVRWYDNGYLEVEPNADMYPDWYQDFGDFLSSLADADAPEALNMSVSTGERMAQVNAYPKTAGAYTARKKERRLKP